MGTLLVAFAHLHLLGAAEVVAQARPDALREEDVGTQTEVVGEAVVVVGHVDQRGRDAHGQSPEGLAHAHLEVEGHLAKIVVVGLHLATKVLGDDADRPFALRHIPVESEIDGHTHGAIVGDVGIDILGRDAAHDIARQLVGQRALYGKLVGRERAHLRARGVGLLHRAVVDILDAAHHRGLGRKHLGVGRARIAHAAHVVHVVEPGRAVAHRGCQGGVGEDERGVVLDDGDILATQRGSMRTHGEAQEVVFSLALLSPCQRGQKC